MARDIRWVWKRAGLLSVAAVAAPVAGQTAHWTNSTASNLWSTPANWNTGVVPGPLTPVIIGAGFPEVLAVGAVSALSINAAGPLMMGGGISSLPQASSFRDLHLVNTQVMAGSTVTIAGVSRMSGASFFNSGPYTNTGTMTVSPGLTINAPATFVNDGTVSVEFAITLDGAGASMINNGTLALVNAGRMLGGGFLINSGALSKAGADDSFIQCSIIQDGSLDVQGGALSLSGGTTFGAGDVSVGSGATLRLDPPATAPFVHSFDGTSVSGDGNVIFAAGSSVSAPIRVDGHTTFNLKGPQGLWLQTSGGPAGDTRIVATGVLHNAGNLALGGYEVRGPGSLVNEAGGALVKMEAGAAFLVDNLHVLNHGTISLHGLLFIGTATLENAADGVLELAYRDIRSWDVGSTLVNAGAMSYPMESAPGTPGPVSVLCRFEQGEGGFTHVKSQDLHFGGGGELGAGGGLFLIGSEGSGEAHLSFAGTYDVTGPGHAIQGLGASPSCTILGGAAIEVHNGADLLLSVEGPSSGVVLQSGAKIGGLGECHNEGLFDWRGEIGIDSQAKFHNDADGLTIIPESAEATLSGIFSNRSGGLFKQLGDLRMDLGQVVNDGVWTIQAKDTFATQIFGEGLFRNSGRLEVRRTVTFVEPAEITADLDNTGTIHVDDLTHLGLFGDVAQVRDGALTGGTWETIRGGSIHFETGFTRIEGGIIRGGTGTIPALAKVREILAGVLDANDTVFMEAPLQVRGGGNLIIRSAMTVPGSTINGTSTSALSAIDQRVVVTPGPPRLMTPLLTNHALLRPGGADAPGPFNLVGDLAQQPTGRLQVEIGGLTPEAEHDRFTITGGVSLGGTLELSLLPLFVPALGQTFAVLAVSGPISGHFAHVQQPPNMPAGLRFVVVPAPGSVIVKVESMCFPDCNGDTALNLSDFGCFQTRFALGDPYSDCNGDTVLNLSDFGCFTTKFALGCP